MYRHRSPVRQPVISLQRPACCAKHRSKITWPYVCPCCRLKKAGAVDDPFLELTGLQAPPPKPQPPLKPSAEPRAPAAAAQQPDPFSSAQPSCDSFAHSLVP